MATVYIFFFWNNLRSKFAPLVNPHRVNATVLVMEKEKAESFVGNLFETGTPS